MPGTIKYLDRTLASPEENLALDEALLDACDSGAGAVLRFWESPQYFVVLGYGRPLAEDVDREACATEGIRILRRCSGGGTVLQGPACLNYALALRIEQAKELNTISGANRFVMERHAAILAELTRLDVKVEGHTDLAVDRVKFSGNAQRRRREALLFHGTFLLGFNHALVERFLRLPKLQPEYRANRTHGEFLRDLPVAAEAVKVALREAWDAQDLLEAIPIAIVNALVSSKYEREDWNLRK